MFKINQKTNEIMITKGDNAALKIKVMDADGFEREIFDDDVIVLTVRKTVDADSTALTKTANKGVVSFIPADTKSLSIGSYHYDIQLTTFGGNIYTIIPDSIFEICQEVTR